MSKENKARYAILGILSAKPASGYDIKKGMQLSTNHFWAETDSSIYPALKQLYLDKCVSCHEESNAGKSRKIYAISERGQMELERWLMQDPETSKSRNEFLLKIFFGWNVPVDICLRHIRTIQSKCENTTYLYEEIYQRKLQQPKTKQHLYQMLTLQNGILLNKTMFEWCQTAILQLTEWKTAYEKNDA